jgi:hypothetical protein
MKGTNMSGNTKNQEDLEVLQQLNSGYLNSDQHGDVKWYSAVLAEDFTASLPDLLLRADHIQNTRRR